MFEAAKAKTEFRYCRKDVFDNPSPIASDSIIQDDLV